MIKKLDKLILKSFLGPFVITFFIAFFVLMMQNLWKYIDDLVGKGLDMWTVVTFIWYASATLSALAMPIAILISSIMTFGNLGESFELVAIKASGISLLRFMRPLIWFTLGLCIITFLFANYVIPYSNLKFVTLYSDIMAKKPTLEFKEGVFYTAIDNYAIKVDKKAANGEDIQNVLIYERGNSLQDNAIIARQGRMSVSPNNDYLQFDLKDGTRYQERGNFGDTATEYIRLQFRTFKKLFDLSQLNKKAVNEDDYRNNYKMLSAVQLDRNLDSLTKARDSIQKAFSKTISVSLTYLKDSNSAKVIAPLKYDPKESLYPDSAEDIIYDRAITKAAELKNTLFFSKNVAFDNSENIRRHKMEWHRKFSFSLACMVLFFIGAPLGSIIRKGGLGMPLVVAIVFFLLFHLLNVFGEKFVKSLILPPVAGMWFAVVLLTPVGFFFTYKAMHDSQLFNKEAYINFFRRLRSYLPGAKKK